MFVYGCCTANPISFSLPACLRQLPGVLPLTGLPVVYLVTDATAAAVVVVIRMFALVSFMVVR